MSKLTPASAPAPSGRRPDCALGEREALAVAREHPEVREQMVAEVHGLRALQVGVAGHRPVDVLLGALEQHRHQLARARSARRRRARACTSPGRSPPDRCASARCAAARRPDRRARSGAARSPCGCLRPRRRTGSAPRAARARPRRVPRAARRGPRAAMIRALGEHPRVRARLRDVLRPQPPVEARSRSSGAGSRGAGARGSVTRSGQSMSPSPGPARNHIARAPDGERRRTWVGMNHTEEVALPPSHTCLRCSAAHPFEGPVM